MADVAMIDELDRNGHYTYADYLLWDNSERCQLIDGEIFMMASPSVAHQALQVELLTDFNNWLRGKSCRVFGSPLDVRLFPKKDKSDKTIVQPDLLIVCDSSKLDKGSVNGAPDLIIEISSPSNTSKEIFLKFQYYLKAKVREYWVIEPDLKIINVHIYENGYYKSASYDETECISVSILPGLEIDLKELWARIPVV